MVPAITEPTRDSSCLDHIYVSRSQLNLAPLGVVCRSVITDHYPVMIGMNLRNLKQQRLSRSVLKRDLDAIKKDLADVDWCFITSVCDTNEATTAFTKFLSDIVVKHTREIRLSRSKRNLKPWITPGLMRCMRHRDRLHQRAKIEPYNSILQISYKRYQNFFVSLLRKLRIEYERKELDKNKGNPRMLWKSVKSVCSLSTKTQVPTELLSLQNSVDSRNSLDLCNDHFSTVGQRLANQILSDINQTQDDLAKIVSAENTLTESFFMGPTDHEEVEKLIIGLQNGKAPGIDGLTNTLIKHIKDEIVIPLTHIYNQSFSDGIFPDAWKVATVSPIHKNGPKNCIGNYRPISLLTTFSKLLEKLVNNRLTSFFESRNIISARQFGFQKGKCTEDAVSLLTSIVSSKLDKKQRCVAVFLDLAKAFDTVSIPILLKKLFKVGIRGVASGWFKSYLWNRRQCVKVGDDFSGTQTIDFGVPQGSILGPTLFNLYINDIHDMQFDNAEIVCYADDTAILFHGSNWERTLEHAELGMAGISGWLQKNLLTLNTKKTVYLCFHKTAASAPVSQLNLKLHKVSCDKIACNCESLARSKTIKYLGVILDENLSFKCHLAALSARVRKVIGIMKNLRDVACPDILMSVYFALCQSLLNYCITCWGSAATTFIILAERAQRSVLKVMMKKPLRYPTVDVFKDSGVLSVRQLFIFKMSLSVHRSVLAAPDYDKTIKKRSQKLTFPQINTSFGQRFGPFIRVHVYNAMDKHCNLRKKTVYEAKKSIYSFLTTLSYKETENLLKIVS